MRKPKDEAEGAAFPTEEALCHAFALQVPEEWVVYPESAGWDMLLVHREGGWQVGVEAKLALNTKVLIQADGRGHRWTVGPDFRAVLVAKTNPELETLAKRLGFTVIRPKQAGQWSWPKFNGFNRRPGPPIPTFHPPLPETERLVKIREWWSDWSPHWLDCYPLEREKVPEFVPEVKAGVPSPMILSDWKIAAMRLCIWLRRNRSITRAHFKAFKIDPSRWMNGHWLCPGLDRGVWEIGPSFPAEQFEREHPNIWAKLEATYEEWSRLIPPPPPTTKKLI